MPGTLDCFSDVSPTQGDFNLTSSHTFWLQARATIFLTVRVSDSLRNNGCSRTQERLNIIGTSPHHFLFCFSTFFSLLDLCLVPFLNYSTKYVHLLELKSAQWLCLLLFE